MAKEAEKEKPKSGWLARLPFLTGLLGPHLLLLLLALVMFIGTSGTHIEKLSAACRTVKNILPVIALLSFIVAFIGYVIGIASRWAYKKKVPWLNSFAIGLLISGVITLLIAASASFYLTMFVMSILGGSTVPLVDPKDTFTC